MHVLAAGLALAGHPVAQGWSQLGDLGVALVLSAAIGLEREIRQKSAGLRTHTLVGVGAALFMLVSKFGFYDVVLPGRVTLDPSRVAAQIVSGVGFLGAGLIFVQRGSVRGLTTAAAVWVTAAIGMAAGAGLPIIAATATAMYLVVALAFQHVARWLPRSGTAISPIMVRYADGRGILRDVLRVATGQGFVIDEVSAELPGHAGITGHAGIAARDGQAAPPLPMVQVTLHVHGRSPVDDLAASLSELDGVEAVSAGDVNAIAD